MRIEKWVMHKKDYKNFSIDWFLNNWKCVWLVIPISFKDRKHNWWSSPPVGILKHNVDGVDRDKPGTHKGLILVSFSSFIGVKVQMKLGF